MPGTSTDGKRLALAFLSFAALFFLGCLAGSVFPHLFARFLTRVVADTFEAVGHLERLSGTALLPVFLLTFVYLKNFLVAALCFLGARPTRGIFPGVVCLVNGLVLGWLGAVLAEAGVSPWRYAGALAPHGVVELPAVFAASALGMARTGGGATRQFAPVACALLVAACIEVFVSPHVAKVVGLT
ncbi:protein of unknown function DUF95 transmembrane [Ammonifex degensii KC4]|uniref:Stage II sporulation protein M n=1 Tax=Ammonifex degensii (strain DSM 10501 / KC4) TaxID=429009 RepID=C9RCG1_AMMDK|nr:stage II sporulation protein M [Ammonifex degensii]ACX51938.1 protein of unknown function DUF95 transmembrane [Ammonifex degensii KC4]